MRLIDTSELSGYQGVALNEIIRTFCLAVDLPNTERGLRRYPIKDLVRPKVGKRVSYTNLFLRPRVLENGWIGQRIFGVCFIE